MKRILLAVMFGIGVLGFAQNSEKKLEKMMKKQIGDKIKGYNPTDLVPYSKDGKKWALMDVKSRKILTDFILDEPSTFNPDIYINIDETRYRKVRISWEYTVGVIREMRMMGSSMDIMKTQELGFQVDKYKRIISHHADYKNISSPIMYKGEYYAIISSKEKEGRILINSKGEEQEGFHFREMKDTYYEDKESGETILYVEDFEGKRGFITISGKRKLYGELLNNGWYDGRLGYSVQKDSRDLNEVKKSGVVDMTTQEWLIKPQEKYKIYDIKYVAPKYPTNRAASIIYFLATDQSGQRFVLDIKGKPILPKN